MNNPDHWLTANGAVVPGDDYIDVWRIDLSDSSLEHEEILSDDERRRVEKFAIASGRNTFVRSRCTLRRILSTCLDCPADEIEFRYNDHDKPELATLATENIHFNLSHSGEIALICVSQGRRTGIDVNQLGRTSGWKAVAKRTFSDAELKSFSTYSEIEQEAIFYSVWSQKEAYTKAIGDGFSYGFQNITVEIDAAGAMGLVADNKCPESVDGWWILALDAAPGCVAALAYDAGGTPTIRQWQFIPGLPEQA